MRKVFKLFDEDNENHISIDNLRKIATELNEPLEDHELEEMIDRAKQVSGDNTTRFVSFEEFYELLSKKSAP
jgi:Ca2+-binding EF-hand superfamily protein